MIGNDVFAVIERQNLRFQRHNVRGHIHNVLSQVDVSEVFGVTDTVQPEVIDVKNRYSGRQPNGDVFAVVAV